MLPTVIAYTGGQMEFKVEMGMEVCDYKYYIILNLMMFSAPHA